MGKAQRDKGARNERAVVNHWRENNVRCDRVPLSGAVGGSYAGDIDLYAFGAESAPLVGEVKARGQGQGFKTIRRWLGENDFLVLHEDRTDRLYVVPEALMLRLITRR
jgi:hypothetical protein